MLNKRLNLTHKNLLLSLYIITLGIFVPIAYWLINADRQPSFTRKKQYPIQQRISSGEKILVTANNSVAKQSGVKAFADGDYVTAQEQINTSLKSDRNDPEARIYLNNTLAAKTKDPYKIGVSVPIGGNLDVAKEILRGVAQAQDEVNQAGGINGKLMIVKIANDDNDSTKATEIAKKFIKDKQITAVIGHNSSNVSAEVAPIYQESELVMITPTSSAADIPKLGEYIFRSTPSTRGLAEPLADYAVNTLGKKNIAICFDSQSAAITSFRDEFTYSVFNLGGKVATVPCDFSEPKFLATEIPSQMVSSGADALLLAPSLRKIDEAIAVAQANQERLPLLGSHTLNNYSILKEGQSATKGMALAVAWNPLVEPQNKFNLDAAKLWGGLVSWRTAMAYDAAKTIFAGLNVQDTRQGLQQTLHNPDFVAEGATSAVSFLPSGDRNLQGTLIQVQPGDKSGTGFDFVPLVAHP
ncbi:MAG: ABC transporter substrate-binding protein [Cyanobacteria bacterium J06621_12]